MNRKYCFLQNLFFFQNKGWLKGHQYWEFQKFKGYEYSAYWGLFFLIPYKS